MNEKMLNDQFLASQLRERFLRLTSKLAGGYNCQMRLHDNTEITCAVKGFDANFENVIVENLITMYPNPIPRALIRTNDVMSMHFSVETL